MKDDQIKANYLAWWKDSFGVPPNARAVSVAVSWGRHLVDAIVGSTPSPEPSKPLWKVMRDIDRECFDAGGEALPYAEMLNAIAERIETEPSIVKFSGACAFLRAEAKRLEREG